MQMTVAIDETLLAQAREITGLTETSAIMQKALKSLVEREAARQLAKLGGSAPDFAAPPRRRFDPE